VPVAEINPFSHAKSNIKFLEAAAVGTPVISSPVHEMKYSIENGINGWIAEDNGQWIQCLKKACTENSADYAGESAHHGVMERFSDGASGLFSDLLAAIAEIGVAAGKSPQETRNNMDYPIDDMHQ
jgi:glycosyltransferase involved in cell wall biosynthesis